jgi:hypothetical protein
MQSNAIALPQAALDQSTSEPFYFGSQSFVSPCFSVFEESNFFSICSRTMIQSFCRCHDRFHSQAAPFQLQATASVHIPLLTNSGTRVSGSMKLQSKTW